METTSTPKKMLVGFPALQSYLEKQPAFTSIKIANSHNDKTNWRKEFNGKPGETIPQLVDYLEQWAPEDAAYTWYICLFNAKNQIERFPFSKLAGTMAGVNAATDRELVNQLIAAERKNAELEAQLNMIASADLESEEEDEEDESFLGKVAPYIEPHLPQIMPVLIDGIMNAFGRKPQIALGSVITDDIQANLQILMDAGLTAEHIKKLATMATSEPGKFKGLLFML